MLWTKFKRSAEIPNFVLLDPIAQLQNLLTLAEILFENKKILDYTLLQGYVMVHNHADATVFVDNALKQVRVGVDILYQCPAGKSFLFTFAGSVTLPAAVNLDIVRYVDPAGALAFDVDSITQTASIVFRNAAAGLTSTTPVTLRFYVLEY
jgi:hypothetical protein